MKTTATSIIKKLLLIILIISSLYFAKEFLIPLSIGAVIATLFLPFCRWIENKKIPRAIAVSICLLIVLVFVSCMIFLFGWQISELAGDFNLIKQSAIEKWVVIQQYIFNHLGIAIEKQSQILFAEQPSISNIMQTVFGSAKTIFINFIMVITYFFLLLYYRNHIKKFFIKLTPLNQRDEVNIILNSTVRVSQQYLVGLSKMIFCLWIMYGIGFGILGVNNFIFFAILCGLFEIVPYIGNITGTTLTVLVTAIHGADTPILIGIIVTYGIVQFIQGWFLEPLILGPQVKINPLFTIIALILGELIWGIPGIVLAIPITAVSKIIFDHIEPLKPYGFLIGSIEKSNKSLTK